MLPKSLNMNFVNFVYEDLRMYYTTYCASPHENGNFTNLVAAFSETQDGISVNLKTEMRRKLQNDA